MKKEEDGKVIITLLEALKLLPEKDEVHTFLNPAAGMLVGADWPMKDIIMALALSKEIHLTGEAAQAMDHGIAIKQADGVMVFIETRKKEKLGETEEDWK